MVFRVSPAGRGLLRGFVARVIQSKLALLVAVSLALLFRGKLVSSQV
jgi:hypothetical protein